MKFTVFKPKNVETFDKSLDVVELFRNQPSYDTNADEGVIICNLSDVIEKHEVWKQYLPRVKPFYGKCLKHNYLKPKIERNTNFNLFD